MKILKLIADYDKNMKPDDVKSFIYKIFHKNLSQDLKWMIHMQFKDVSKTYWT